jgi:hypothetical protein
MRRTVTMRLRRAAFGSSLLLLGLPMVAASAASAAPQVVRPAAVPVTTTSNLKLDVVSARDSTLRPPRGTDPCAPFRGMHLLTPGTPAGCGSPQAPFTYKWIINADNTGDPHQTSSSTAVDPTDTVNDGSDVCHPLTATNPDGDPAFPANCTWASIHPVLASPVVTQGDSSEWNLSQTIANLPNGKYLVSVSADGFEIGGAHFTVPMKIADPGTPNPTGTITVGLNPYPIPLGTIQVKVFEDAAPVDGTFDATTEHGLAGWNATVNDILGQVSTDWYVNPICTEYQRTVPAGLDGSPPSPTMSPTEAIAYYGTGGAGESLAVTYYGAALTYDDYVRWGVGLVDGEPVRVPGTGGKCLSDANGIIRVPNRGTNR